MFQNSKTIVVIGMGYVGIPCAALFADVPGFRVIGVQRRSERSGWKIDWLNAGKCPIEGEEPGLAELIHRVVVDKGTFRVTDDYSVCREADAILIDVQTPVDEKNIPQYESLVLVSQQVGRHLRPGTLVIIESTVAPGTTQNVVRPILERESGLRAGKDFYLAFSYERVMPGKLLEYITDFPRVVGGIDEESTRQAVELYRHIVRAEIHPTDTLTAEMAKVVENAYRDVNIAFANEVALLCESIGVNVYEVRRLINARPDRHMHLPGAGVGGHCLPKDSWLLVYGVRTYGQGSPQPRLIPIAREINAGMPQHMFRLIRQGLEARGRNLSGARVVLLGVSYLENTDDTRNTPAVPLTRYLLAYGAEVLAHDPYVREPDWRRELGNELSVPLSKDLWLMLEGSDCAAVVTGHRIYYEIDLARMAAVMRSPVLVDGRNVFDGKRCRAVGLVYYGLGKGR